MPSGPKRLKERGYNHAELIAKSISKQLNIPLDTKTLTKPTDTPPQSKLSAEKRQSALKGKLVITNRETLKDKRIMLIDDVRTTGASLNEASKVLLKHGGAKAVMCRTFAQAD
jgi:ComF family protein